MSGRPVAWINTSVSPTGAVAAHEELRRVLTFVQADIVEAACVDLPVPRAVRSAPTASSLRLRSGTESRTSYAT